MKTQFVQAQLEQAIADYAKSTGITLPVLDIEFKMTRKDNAGLTANVTFDTGMTTASAANVKSEAPKSAEAPAPTEQLETPTTTVSAEPLAEQESPAPVVDEAQPSPAPAVNAAADDNIFNQ